MPGLLRVSSTLYTVSSFHLTGWRQLRLALRTLTDEKRLKRDAFSSVPQLIDAIMGYVDHHNDDPKPIVWTKAADLILDKVGRARAILDKSATA